MTSKTAEQNHLHVRALALVLLALTTVLSSIPAQDGVAVPKESKRSALATAFFADPAVRVFDLHIPVAELPKLSRSSNTYVAAEIREGETILTNVGVRLKGNGSFRSLYDKPSFAIKFDAFVEDQTYRGLKKLMFNNSVQDPSYLSELLATELFRDAGVPAARVTYARLRLNERELGLYVVVEAMNKDFLKHNFGSSKGNLYEAYLRDVYSNLEQDNGEDLSKADVRALCQACVTSDPAKRWRELNKVLDVDRFVSFVAMEMLVTHWDGYTVLLNNYRIYHDPKTDKMVFITHGLDGAFRRPNFSIQAPQKAMVVTAVLTTPEGGKLFDERIRNLAKDVFKVPVIVDRMEKAMARLRNAGLDPSTLPGIERYAAIKRQRIELRADRVDEQLRGVKPETMKLDANGSGIPVAWRDEPDRGEAVFDRVEIDGKKALHILAREESTRASWRSQVYLTPGMYRFEGLVRTELLAGGSARLRISGNSSGVAGIVGSSPWRSMAYDFAVGGEGMDVELVCELNGMQGGEVWFDLDTMRVKQIGPAPVQRTIQPQLLDPPAREPVVRPRTTIQL